MFVEKPFSPLHNLEMNCGNVLWSIYYNGGRNVLHVDNTESAIQTLVRYAIEDAIAAVGLSRELACFNELSVFRLRAVFGW